jgi:hypothetical protein
MPASRSDNARSRSDNAWPIVFGGKRVLDYANWNRLNRHALGHMNEPPITNYLAYLLAQANRQMSAQLTEALAKRACRSSTGASSKC